MRKWEDYRAGREKQRRALEEVCSNGVGEKTVRKLGLWLSGRLTNRLIFWSGPDGRKTRFFCEDNPEVHSGKAQILY